MQLIGCIFVLVLSQCAGLGVHIKEEDMVWKCRLACEREGSKISAVKVGCGRMRKDCTSNYLEYCECEDGTQTKDILGFRDQKPERMKCGTSSSSDEGRDTEESVTNVQNSEQNEEGSTRTITEEERVDYKAMITKCAAACKSKYGRGLQSMSTIRHIIVGCNCFGGNTIAARDI